MEIVNVTLSARSNKSRWSEVLPALKDKTSVTFQLLAGTDYEQGTLDSVKSDAYQWGKRQKPAIRVITQNIYKDGVEKKENVIGCYFQFERKVEATTTAQESTTESSTEPVSAE